MKRFMILLIVFAVITSFGVGKGNAKTFELTYSVVAMPTVAHAKAITVFAEEVEKLTNGQVKIKVYTGGELFTQEGQSSAIRRGTLDMTNAGPNWLAEFVPYLSMFAAAYFFKDYDHMTAIMNGAIGRAMYDDIAQKMGVRPLATWYMGTRQLNLRDIGRVVKTPADMKGVKLRMPNSPTWLFMGKALGANPTPISISELYMALKTGTVDGQDNPLPNSIKRKFYEVTKYTILSGHYVNPIMPVINEKKWQELGPELQEKMYQAIEKARQFCDNLIMEETRSGLDLLKEKGMIIVEVDKDVWRKHVSEYYLNDKEMTKDWDIELYNRIQSMAK